MDKQTLLDKWNHFTLLHQKACQGKGTVGKPGIKIEYDRQLLNEFWGIT